MKTDSAWEAFMRARGCTFVLTEHDIFAHRIYREMLRSFLIVDAHYEFALRGIRYTGLHEKLPPVPEGDAYPHYQVHDRRETVLGGFQIARLYLMDAQGNVPLEWFA